MRYFFEKEKAFNFFNFKSVTLNKMNVSVNEKVHLMLVCLFIDFWSWHRYPNLTIEPGVPVVPVTGHNKKSKLANPVLSLPLLPIPKFQKNY